MSRSNAAKPSPCKKTASATEFAFTATQNYVLVLSQEDIKGRIMIDHQSIRIKEHRELWNVGPLSTRFVLKLDRNLECDNVHFMICEADTDPDAVPLPLKVWRIDKDELKIRELSGDKLERYKSQLVYAIIFGDYPHLGYGQYHSTLRYDDQSENHHLQL